MCHASTLLTRGSINYRLSFIDLVTNLERFFVAVTNVERLRAKGVHADRSIFLAGRISLEETIHRNKIVESCGLEGRR